MEPTERLVSLAVLLKPLKSLTIFFFFSGAGLLLLALCLAAIDVGDGLFWVVAGLAVLVPLASLAHFATAIVARAQEGLPLRSSDLISLGIMCAMVVPVHRFCALGMAFGRFERGTMIFLAAAGLSTVLSAARVLVGFAVGQTA